MGLGKDEERQSTRTHWEGVPSPCKMVKAVFQGHLGSVRVEHIVVLLEIVFFLLIVDVVEWVHAFLHGRSDRLVVDASSGIKTGMFGINFHAQTIWEVRATSQRLPLL